MSGVEEVGGGRRGERVEREVGVGRREGERIEKTDTLPTLKWVCGKHQL